MTTTSPATGFDEEQLLAVLTALKDGDFTRRMPTSGTGTEGKIAETLNALLDQLQGFEAEAGRITREIGTEGLFGGQAEVPGLAGSWKVMLGNLNFMSANLTEQVRNVSEVTYAVARGDLSKRITVPVRGELLELKTMINGMIDQLNVFASECNRITHEIGAGKFGGQVEVPGVDGSWQDFVTSLNRMSATLTTYGA